MEAVPEGDALENVLLYHVVEGTFTTTDISEGVTSTAVETPFTLETEVEGAVLTFTNPAAGLTITDSAGETAEFLTVDQMPTGIGATGVFHSIDAVLTPPEVTETPVGTDPGTGATGGLGEIYGEEFSQATTALDNVYGAGTFESAQWTLFLPDNATLGAAGVTTVLTESQINGHLNTTSIDNAGLIEIANSDNPSIQSAGGESTQIIAITLDTEGNPLVGGFAVTPLGVIAGTDADGNATMGAQAYSLAGILPAAGTDEPAAEPENDPTTEPEVDPAAEPEVDPAAEPEVDPAAEPEVDPAAEPEVDPTAEPEVEPTAEPEAS